jgi:hypothetical protein
MKSREVALDSSLLGRETLVRKKWFVLWEGILQEYSMNIIPKE